MKRTYPAQILNKQDDTAYLNIDLGFRTWHMQEVFLGNLAEWKKYSVLDWVVVNIYQHKYPISTIKAEYNYEAIVVSKAKEPRAVYTQ